MAIQHKPSGSVVTISNDDHPALASHIERSLEEERQNKIQALMSSKDWADFEKRRGEINGLAIAAALCKQIDHKLKN